MVSKRVGETMEEYKLRKKLYSQQWHKNKNKTKKKKQMPVKEGAAKKVSDSEIREMLIEMGMAQQRYWNDRSPLALQHHPRMWGRLEDIETKKVQGYGEEELYREAKESGLVADNKELTDGGIAHQKNLRAGHVSLGEKGTEFFYSGPSIKERKQKGDLKREIDEFDKEVRSSWAAALKSGKMF